jgi:hypothetical protein
MMAEEHKRRSKTTLVEAPVPEGDTRFDLVIGGRTFTFTAKASKFIDSLRELTAWLPILSEKLQPTETVERPFYYKVTNVSADYDIVASDAVILGDASNAEFTVSLPSCVFAGRRLLIVKVDSGPHNVIVAPYGKEKIQEEDSVTLGSQWDKVALVSDGVSNWIIENLNPPT